MGTDEADDGKYKVYYKKLMIFFFLPPLCVALAMIFWTIHSAIYKGWKKFRSKTISSVVVMFFLIHPTVSKWMFTTFNCMDIEN